MVTRMFLTVRLRLAFVLVTALVLPGAPRAQPAAGWPQFRGPHADGVVEDAIALPDRWSETEHVRWVTEVNGFGWSSPVVWGDRIFVTSAVGGRKEPSKGIFGQDYVAELVGQGMSPEAALRTAVDRDTERTTDIGEVRYLVQAYDLGTGRLVWEREAHRGEPFAGRHRKNTFASETPATDGERVYAYFGNVGLFAYGFDGSLQWSRRWAPQPTWATIGTASSPVVHGGRVYVLHDSEGDAFMAGVDARTGREVFVTPRRDGKARAMTGWSTPFVWRHSRRTEIVTVGRGLVVSYDLDGKEIWRMAGVSGSATPSPLSDGRLLFVGTGSQGESNRPMFAIRPGASGDISLEAGATASEYVAWTQPRVSSYTPSPLVYRDRMYLVNDNGVLTVLEAATGRQVYRARVGGGGYTFSASPWANRGKVFLLSEDGDTFVLEAGDTYLEAARNRLGAMTLATPAVAGDTLVIRTRTRLYRVGQATPAAAR